MRIRIIQGVLVVSAIVGIAEAASAEQWRGRAIYQLLTDRFARTDGSTNAPCNTADRIYCGGTWRSIVQQLDYIKSMGFTAVWISPVTYNIPYRTAYGDSYHGYWQQELYRLNDRFGNADDLRALSRALHDKGMYLMVDVVTNHFGWAGSSSTVGYSQFRPFNDAKYFHTYCPVDDWDNQTEVEHCWLGDPKVELPDLRTEDQAVKDMYATWVGGLVSNYSIDGLRLDTAKHVDKAFWTSFQQAAGVYVTGEVLAQDVSYVCDYQNHLSGLLNYPLYDPMMIWLNSTVGSTTLFLYTANRIKSQCRDSTVLGTFSENHDLPRFASQTQDMSLAKNALALTILWDGIPIVYAGQEHHYAGNGDPANREATWLSKYSRQSELYKLIASLNQVRNRAISIDPGYLTFNTQVIYSDSHTLALRKGFDGKQIVSVITNVGYGNPAWTLNLQNTGWTSGTVVVEIFTCQRLDIGDQGNFNVPMENGMPRVYISKDAIAGSGICAGTTD